MPFDNAGGHVVDDGRDDRADASLHPFEQLGDNEIIGEGVVEKGNDRDDQKRRQRRAEHSRQDAGETAQLVAGDDRAVDSDRPRRRLSDRDHVEHFIFFEPVIFIDEAVLHQRDDDVTAAKSERAQRERGAEQLEQRNFFFHRTPPLCSLFSIDLFAYIVHQRIFYRRKMNTAARVSTCGSDCR